MRRDEDAGEAGRRSPLTNAQTMSPEFVAPATVAREGRGSLVNRARKSLFQAAPTSNPPKGGRRSPLGSAQTMSPLVSAPADLPTGGLAAFHEPKDEHPFGALIQQIKWLYDEHMGLQTAVIAVENRLRSDSHRQAHARHKQAGTLVEGAFCNADDIDREIIAKRHWRLHSVLDTLTAHDVAVDKKMAFYAKRLRHMAEFVEAADGFSWPSMAGIIGEAGNLSTYPTYHTFIKRMGLAMIDGPDGPVIQGYKGNLGKKLTMEQAMAIGYVARRRALVRVIGKCLSKTTGKYRKIYEARKAYENERAIALGVRVLPSASWKKLKPEAKATAMTLQQVDYRALRYMEKKFLRHLWQTWRRGCPDVSAMVDCRPDKYEAKALAAGKFDL